MKKILSLVVLALLASAPKFAHATNDGTPSTGSFTVVYSTNLAHATATGNLTVLSTSGLSGTYFNIGPFQFVAGRDYTVGASTNTTAANIATALNAFTPYGPQAASFVTAANTTGDNVVYLTALSYGSAYNSVGLRTSNNLKVSTSAVTLTGGLDDAVVSVNGIKLVQGRDWFALDVASNTAVSLSAAINHAPALQNLVSGYTQGTGLVYLRSLLTPTAYPLEVTDNSSTNANLNVSAAAMTGGASGQLAILGCYLGIVNALPSTGYPKGCLLFLNTDATHIYVSTKAVTGAEAAAAYWLAK